MVTPHLENRAKPDIRKLQLEQVLEEIHSIDHPVVVASDFNTTGTDFSPKTFTGLLEQAFLSQDMTPELDVLQARSDDAMCCPSQKLTRRWALHGSRLREREPQNTGTLLLRDLEGAEWMLTHFDRNDPAPHGTTVTLSFNGNQVAGHGACNRYFSELSAGDSPGAVAVGPIESTRMACPGDAADVEARFVRQLEGVTRYGFLAGKLVLTTNAGTTRTMFFSRAR
ncbi:MAG TPA: META domain-containing protein [Vicinamibacteria bacterium]|nr:META domain-containing protein [Vicinamibacteria bacterium]